MPWSRAAKVGSASRTSNGAFPARSKKCFMFSLFVVFVVFVVLWVLHVLLRVLFVFAVFCAGVLGPVRFADLNV
jgi:cytoskeletal protein RodZ